MIHQKLFSKEWPAIYGLKYIHIIEFRLSILYIQDFATLFDEEWHGNLGVPSVFCRPIIVRLRQEDPFFSEAMDLIQGESAVQIIWD
jgi:hypothetical protein